MTNKRDEPTLDKNNSMDKALASSLLKYWWPALVLVAVTIADKILDIVIDPHSFYILPDWIGIVGVLGQLHLETALVILSALCLSLLLSRKWPHLEIQFHRWLSVGCYLVYIVLKLMENQ
jgi:hypothetical protein